MLTLTPADVHMNAQANSKDDALRLLANILTEGGFTTPEYLTGLQEREAQATTYLGQGIAIPHGTPASRIHIKQTGVKLVHFAQGVEWTTDGDKVYLAAAIAARSDEHLTVLKMLTRALSSDIADDIKYAKTPQDILSALGNVQKTFTLQEKLIKTAVSAKGLDELYQTALNGLKDAGLLGDTLGIKPELTRLSKALYAVVLEDTDKVFDSGLALAVAKKPIIYQADKVQALAVIASNNHADNDKLSHVYDVLLGSEFSQKLGKADSRELAQLLGAEHAQDWQAVTATIVNPLGLHARPATLLSDIAKQATGEIKVALDNGAYVSAKSLARLLSLGGTHGHTLTFIAEPNTDAGEYLDKLAQAVESGLGEEVVPIHIATQAQALDDTPTITPLQHGEKYNGVPASGGLAVGIAHVVKPISFSYPMTASDPKAELARLHLAIDDVKTELTQLVQTASKATIAKIFTAHVALLDDEEVTCGAKDGIDDGLSAPAAWHAHIEAMAKAQSSLTNRLLAERADDLRDIGQKVLAKLTGQSLPHTPNTPYVLIKQELLPSDVARLDPKQVAGILTATGGAGSHSAIVARALGIPAIVGADMGVLGIEQGQTVLLDGSKGYFVVAPSSELINACQSAQTALQEKKRLAETFALDPAMTTDGHQVEVVANIGNVNDTAGVVEQGAEGIGLLRTELVFMAHQEVPDIETQIADYRKVFDGLDGRPLVVRTLDIGGDKPLAYLPMPAEDNPFLGVRGIRLTLARPKLLRDQLIALIRASEGRDLRIMFPMVGRIEEWHAAKAILDDVLKDYPHNNLQVGIMIEVPSAVLIASAFAKEVDFFSIGTNDLTQYTLAIDRGHPTLSKDADGLHPSVLQLIHQTVQAAHAYGKWVGVCGELAGDEHAVPILLGLGVDELSMSGTSIALTKAQIRTLDLATCQTLAQQALLCSTTAQVRALSDNLN